MKYYKVNGLVHALEDDGSQDYLITEAFVPMTVAEIEAHLTPDVDARKTKFTSLEYLDRFTEVEQLAVVRATMNVPEVKLWYDRMLAASYVDINDPRVESGVNALIEAGLLDAERKSALLAPSPI